jgi:hypothetical protein
MLNLTYMKLFQSLIEIMERVGVMSYLVCYQSRNGQSLPSTSGKNSKGIWLFQKHIASRPINCHSTGDGDQKGIEDDCNVDILVCWWPLHGFQNLSATNWSPLLTSVTWNPHFKDEIKEAHIVHKCSSKVCSTVSLIAMNSLSFAPKKKRKKKVCSTGLIN